MSKNYLKEFFNKFNKAEKCSINPNEACETANNLNNRLDGLDLRYNRNKEKVLSSLQQLQNKEGCNMCDATDGVFSDLASIWKKNKLKY